MSGNTQDLEKFLQEVAKNPSMQETLKQKAQHITREAEVNRLILEQAQSAGYSVDTADIDELISNAKESQVGAELTDESLEQVNGGSFIIGASLIAAIFVGIGVSGAIGGTAAALYE